jgi:hypothetical protein
VQGRQFAPLRIDGPASNAARGAKNTIFSIL